MLVSSVRVRSLGVRTSSARGLVAKHMARPDQPHAVTSFAAFGDAGHLMWGGVKTHEARTARLPRSVADELGVYLASRPNGPDDLLFTAPRGGPLRESKFVPGRFKPAVGAANQAIAQRDKQHRPALLPEGLRLYDLRHTAASLMIREGASVKAVQRQLGHATASITLDVDGHLFPDELDALAGRLERARTEALAGLARTQHGPAVVPLREGAGQ
jgi:integrase